MKIWQIVLENSTMRQLQAESNNWQLFSCVTIVPKQAFRKGERNMAMTSIETRIHLLARLSGHFYFQHEMKRSLDGEYVQVRYFAEFAPYGELA